MEYISEFRGKVNQIYELLPVPPAAADEVEALLVKILLIS